MLLLFNTSRRQEVKGATFRFTIRTAQRELKLKAASAADYEVGALLHPPHPTPPRSTPQKYDGGGKR